jgi:hypothetical protein
MLERICDVVSRKRKIGLGVLAVLIVFCLWYTRPRSFEELVGDGRVKSISMVTSIYVFEEGLPHFDVWTVDSHEGREAVNEELEALLKSCKYRVSLRTLFQFLDGFLNDFLDIYAPPKGENEPIIDLVAVLDNDSSVFAVYRGASVTLEADRRMFVKAVDKEIADKLLAYAQEFGVQSENKT